MSGPAPHPPQEPVQLPDRLKHGSYTAYQRYRCRCLPCQENAREQARRRDRERKQYRSSVMKHGKVSGYTYHGCRCEDCKAARRSYDRERWEIRNRSQEGKKR